MIPRGHITLVALVAAALVLLLAPGRALAQENRDDVYVRVNGTVDLAAGESVDTLVAVNSEAQVAGTVRDTLVIVNRTATVSGDVGRDAIVANGTLRLEPTARIGGDVVLINGRAEIRPTARRSPAASWNGAAQGWAPSSAGSRRRSRLLSGWA